MVTPQRLVILLKRLGYPMTDRGLTDWRQKGLLPALVSRGRGKGRGKAYGWPEVRVVRQAITVWELLAASNRSEIALLFGWFCGGDMDITRVRALWLKQLQQQETVWRKDLRPDEDLEDALSRRALHAPKQKGIPLPRLARVALNELIGNIFLNPGFQIEDFDPKVFSDIAKGLGARNLRGGGLSRTVAPADIRRFIECITPYFSVHKRIALIRRASDDALRQAQTVASLIQKLLRLFMEIFDVGPLSVSVRVRLSAMIGLQAVYTFLFLQQMGYAGQLARTEAVLKGILRDRQWWRELRATKSGDGIPGTWQDDRWKQLFGIWEGVKLCAGPAEVI